MSSKPDAIHWIPFQCPSCFGLFRLRKDQLGQAGHCPTCRVVVEVTGTGPAASATPPPAPQVMEEVPTDLLDRVAVAQEMTPEEILQKDLERKARRKHTGAGGAGGADKIDWEEKVDQEEETGISWRVVTSLVLSALALAAVGVYYVNVIRPSSSVAQSTGAGQQLDDAFFEELRKRDGSAPIEEEGEDQALISAVDDYQKFDLEQAEAAVRGFLTAKSIDELKKYVRDPERVRPLMDSYYERVDYIVEGMEEMGRSSVSYQGELLTATVQTADFLSHPIAVERTPAEEGYEYLVDWESWVGYCDWTPEEMRNRRPSKPFMVRAILGVENYYNYGFSDDQKWRSYNLELRNSNYAFLGYVERNSELDDHFIDLRKNGKMVRFLLKVAYPPDVRAKDQVEIIEVISMGWVPRVKKEKDDE